MEGEISMTNCVKTQRSSLLASLNPEQQPHSTSLVDHPDATPATTAVKRSSEFHGISRHHQSGRYEGRFGNKYFYLGAGCTSEEADHAYDLAALEHRGINAVTKFDLSTYIRWHRSGANSVCSQQECVKRKMHSDPSNKSSPTALGILLRSPMFKELVEKSMNDEIEENKSKKFKSQSDDGNSEFCG